VEAVSALLPFALILAAFYLLIIRPARNRQRAALQMQQELAPGVEVMTTSGVFATVTAVQDDVVVLEVAPGVTMRFAKAAVGRILTGEDTSAGPHGDVSPDATDDRPDGDQPTR
jgi:preprotein translocase subunit YajC